jgi:hypothetical protein
VGADPLSVGLPPVTVPCPHCGASIEVRLTAVCTGMTVTDAAPIVRGRVETEYRHMCPVADEEAPCRAGSLF